MNKILKLGCLTILIVFLVIVGMCSYGLYKSKTIYEPQLKPHIDNIVVYYNANDYDSIYDKFVSDVKLNISKERNRELTQKYFELTGKILIGDSQGINYKNMNGTETISLAYKYTGEKCSSVIAFSYIKTSSVWQLMGYNINIK